MEILLTNLSKFFFVKILLIFVGIYIAYLKAKDKKIEPDSLSALLILTLDVIFTGLICILTIKVESNMMTNIYEYWLLILIGTVEISKASESFIQIVRTYLFTRKNIKI